MINRKRGTQTIPLFHYFNYDKKEMESCCKFKDDLLGG